MGKCTCHPELETPYICMKHQIYLCEECLECRDPDIYCKFRPSCSIWFMSRQKARLVRKEEERSAALQAGVQVNFGPHGKSVRVPQGTTLLEAARLADVYINASCNGKGACGKCKLVVTAGGTQNPPTPLLSDTEKEKRYILACQSKVVEDVTLEIPPEILERKLKVAGMGKEAAERLKGVVEEIEPMLKEIPLELSPPTIDDSVSDLDRLNRGLKKTGCDVTRLNVGIKVMRQLAEAVRREDWKLTASVIRRKCSNEILEVRPGNGSVSPFGLAIDLGTTTVVVYLVNMLDGQIVAAASGHNRQAECGDDVINRIVCAEKDGVKKLSRMVLATINALIGDVLDSAGIDAAQVKNVVVSGNTTMAHLLLQIEPRYIRREPYIPTVTEFPILKAGEIGFKTNPIAAVFTMPGPASYVGGDIVAGVLYTGLHREDPLTLFIDVGTNGEIVLGNKEWMMTAACSAGPAFEGGGIRWGMRAEEGAVEKVAIDPETFEPVWSTVDDQSPRGICGSGMIDLISELLNAGIIDRSGRFQSDMDHPRISKIKDEAVYILVPADQTAMNEEIVFTESDIKTLIYSKGAVYAGFTTLLNEAGMDLSMIDRIIIAGGFGQYLDIDKAISIGLLPDIERTRFTYTGNSSIAGAYMALLSSTYRQETAQISNAMTYIDFSSNSRYMDEFTSALFLPHTDLDMFPNVTSKVA
ncbi:MAG: ASKHA domain-containing protein [Desulfobacteraceae bacterium]